MLKSNEKRKSCPVQPMTFAKYNKGSCNYLYSLPIYADNEHRTPIRLCSQKMQAVQSS